MTNQPEPSFERELDHVWGAALDWKNSPDFLDEDEATYIRYRDNVIASALIAHNQAIAQAVQAAEAAAAVQLRKDNDFIRMVKREAVREELQRLVEDYWKLAAESAEAELPWETLIDERISQLGEQAE